MTSKIPSLQPPRKGGSTFAKIALGVLVLFALNGVFYLVLSHLPHAPIRVTQQPLTATWLALYTATPSQTPFQPGREPTPTFTPTSSPTHPPTPTFAPTYTPEPTQTDFPHPTSTNDPSGLPSDAEVIGIVGHAQFYNLDCESRSAVDWGRFFGSDLVETTFLNELPKSDDPEKGFVGDYNDPVGQIPPRSYGVHAQPVADLLNSFGVPAQAVKGLTWQKVRNEIANNRPVITWVIYGISPGTPIEYTVPSDGNTVIVAHYEHTVIVIAYTSLYVTVLDGESVYSVPVEQFLDSWSVLGNMAIIAG